MAKKQKSTPAPADDGLKNVSDYRFPEATRKNNPPAKIAAEGLRSAHPEGRVLVQSAAPAGTQVRSDGPRRRVARVAGEGHAAEVDRGRSVGAGRVAAHT